MDKKLYYKNISVLLPVIIILFTFTNVVTVSAEEISSEPYYFYSDNYNSLKLLENIENVTVNPAEVGYTGQGVQALPQNESNGYNGSVLSFAENSSATFEVTVEKAGGYNVTIDYYVSEAYFFNLTLSMAINGEHQFYESRSLDMPVRWRDVSQEYRQDDFGNDIYPSPERIFSWEKRDFNNQLYLLKVPFVFELNAGKNVITIKNNEIPFLLGEVIFSGAEETISAEQYVNEHSQKSFATAETIIVEGEHYSAKSQSYITASKSSNPNVFPYEPPYNRINALAEDSWSDAGNYVEYEFEVPEDGLYYIAAKFINRELKNKPNFKNIYIDGEILFDEMHNYLMGYSSKFTNEVLNVNGENIPIYLTKGKHTLRLESTADPFYVSYENLLSIIGEINELAIQIRYITGNKSDKNREWEIEQYIPTITDDLFRFANTIDEEYERLSELFGGGQSSEITNLRVARDMLLDFTEDLDMLVNNMDRFSQGGNSVTEYISLILPKLLFQNMGIDRIYITSDLDDIPKATIGFFRSVVEGIRSFAYSFTRTQDQGGTISEDELNIWVNKSMMHVELMREKFIEFTELTGIKVNISTLSDEQKLLLAVSAGTGPDMVIGASNYRPFDFALRGAIYDLRQFDDFAVVLEDYNPDMFIPFIIDDSCYAVPEAIDFTLTYFRQDTLNSLGLEVPKTWDEVIKILPELSRFGMSFNTPIANAGGTKHFGTTIPFIQQFEGKIYSEDGSRVELGDPNTVEAFKLMTDLYTRYSLPEDIPSFFNSFKRGVTPIGMATLQTYFLLRSGAPELSGQWGVAPSIGVDDGTGNIRNYQAAVSSCSMIMADTKRTEEAWLALKWWMSEETQLNYSNDLQLRFGNNFINNTANLKAFERMKTIPDNIKAVVLEQLENTREIPRNPAYFEVERSLSNAWNAVVFEGMTPRTALDNAIITSNRQIAIKLREFGYMDDAGNLIRPFRMATRELVESWKKEGSRE